MLPHNEPEAARATRQAACWRSQTLLELRPSTRDAAQLSSLMVSPSGSSSKSSSKGQSSRAPVGGGAQACSEASARLMRARKATTSADEGCEKTASASARRPQPRHGCTRRTRSTGSKSSKTVASSVSAVSSTVPNSAAVRSSRKLRSERKRPGAVACTLRTAAVGSAAALPHGGAWGRPVSGSAGSSCSGCVGGAFSQFRMSAMASSEGAASTR
mmetsp:Transcript_93540/g.260457  ORF Transcript_93540/g.260457 Transcript_93540/m.260457 type:complete len:215 (-) Transcript_93540:209-853(-)